MLSTGAVEPPVSVTLPACSVVPLNTNWPPWVSATFRMVAAPLSTTTPLPWIAPVSKLEMPPSVSVWPFSASVPPSMAKSCA